MQSNSRRPAEAALMGCEACKAHLEQVHRRPPRPQDAQQVLHWHSPQGLEGGLDVDVVEA